MPEQNYKVAAKKIPGFTLIELLVVISIISLLASIFLASVNGTRKKARDSRRLGDLHTLYNVLTEYETTFNGYPINGSCYDWTTADGIPVYSVYSFSAFETAGDIPPGWTCVWPWEEFKQFIPSAPKDPINNQNYTYQYLKFVDVNGNPMTVYVRDIGTDHCDGYSTPPGLPMPGLLAAYLETPIGNAAAYNCAPASDPWVKHGYITTLQ